MFHDHERTPDPTHVPTSYQEKKETLVSASNHTSRPTYRVDQKQAKSQSEISNNQTKPGIKQETQKKAHNSTTQINRNDVWLRVPCPFVPMCISAPCSVPQPPQHALVKKKKEQIKPAKLLLNSAWMYWGIPCKSNYLLHSCCNQPINSAKTKHLHFPCPSTPHVCLISHAMQEKRYLVIRSFRPSRLVHLA